MRLLFEIDKKDYQPDGKAFRRPSARAIIVRNGKIAMIYSRKNKYYKLPGGGIEQEESAVDAMIREVLEETGLKVLPESVTEYGYVHRVQKGKHEPVFIQDNYYYICSAKEDAASPMFSEDELQEDFVLEYVTPQEAIAVNNNASLSEWWSSMLQREVQVLKMLIKERIVPVDNIRRAKPEDFSRISEIQIFNYRLYFYPIFRNDAYYFDELQVAAEMESCRKDKTLLEHAYVYDDGAVKGFIRIDGDEVKKLFVEPVLQGNSIGGKLLEFAVCHHKVKFLWALEKNTRAISFYEKHGFHVTSDRKPEEGTEEYLVRLER